MSKSPNLSQSPLICVVDDDEDVRSSLSSLLRSIGYAVKTFAGPLDFLASDAVDAASCLILDIQLGEADGLEFQQELVTSDASIPIILISGHGDIPKTVRAMKAGAVNFLPKPFEEEALLAAVAEAVSRDQRRRNDAHRDESIRLRYEQLTPREREVMALVAAGLMNKQIAWRLSLSEITVKIHRGNMIRKMQVKSVAELVRLADQLGVRAAPETHPDATPSRQGNPPL
ncbi:two component transcriptional regulator, LuxR family [Rhodopseudomonas palustris HaA2]|uniref:Two component transcriptional regulator, LuxR family n=1 Tax=Rhodopseudomonas palustris (strain HaA2) TaxID=316058 RepID=Q2J3N8_RHOP2|nr:response regulator [Rhodopseudomonas palustris]ABD04922.1 two component transcriptional regulator, LuxR family [Rhodopseudomonas palustris HaA2]